MSDRVAALVACMFQHDPGQITISRKCAAGTLADVSDFDWPRVLGALVRGDDIDSAAGDALAELLRGETPEAIAAGFLVALRAKGESDAEMASMLNALAAAGTKVELAVGITPVLDNCGTGGDGSHTVNVSTIAAFAIAGAGVHVAKHGNRAASSRCGTADVLEQLGVDIEAGPETVARCVTGARIGFCFAPRYQPAMRFLAPVRRALGVPTTMNYLGPLTNPAGATHRLVGVGDPAMAPRMAAALVAIGVERAWVVHGDDGLDEITTTTTTHVLDVRDGEVVEFTLDPELLGIGRSHLADLRGGDTATNAAILRDVLAGKPGPVGEVAVLNAGAALVVAGHSTDLEAGINSARTSIDEGHAAAALDRLIELSHR